MLKNILLISLRSLGKRKFFTLLNVGGLSMSMAFAFLLWLYVQDQQSYDRHYANAERIYRVNADFSMNGKRDIYSNCPRPIGPTFLMEFPEVKSAVRVCGVGGLFTHTAILVLDEKQVKTERIYYVDSTFFDIFEHEFISGNPKEALKHPNSLVLTESIARKFFPDGDALGKSLQLPGNFQANLKITGVVADPERKSHLPIDAWVSWTTFPYEREMTQWYGAHVYTYIMLDESNDIEALHDLFPAFYEKYMKATFDNLNGTADLNFQPLLSIYLDPEHVWEPSPHGSATNVKMLRIIMFFLLAIAAINYVNLATARSAERAAEVGIRKTLGSRRRLLITQFMGESILTALLSGLFALGLVLVVLPYFNQLSGLDLGVLSILTLRNVGMLVILSLCLGVFAGVYPAFYILSFKPVEVLKGRFATGRRGETLRKVLVVTQYCISAILIAGILFVAEQTRFIKNKDIGYDKENLIRVSVPPDTSVSRHLDAYAEKLAGNRHIGGVSRIGYALDQEANHFTPTLEAPDGTRFQTGADFITVDYDFISTVGAEIVAGRNFDRNSGTDASEGFIINETAMKKFGWEKSPLEGKYVENFDPNNVTTYSVIGVVKDFNLGASYQTVHPMMLFLSERGQMLYLRLAGDDIFSSVSAARDAWDALFPAYTFEYTFQDQELAALYQKEEKFLQLLSAFSIVIIGITCLGIVGLISFTVELRKKEIAIRKVNGSPVSGIVMLLSRKFLTLLLVANTVAIPLAVYFIGLWFENFAYHIDLSAAPFFVALAVTIVFTALALSYHTMKAAAANPIEALRYE